MSALMWNRFSLLLSVLCGGPLYFYFAKVYFGGLSFRVEYWGLIFSSLIFLYIVQFLLLIFMIVRALHGASLACFLFGLSTPVAFVLVHRAW